MGVATPALPGSAGQGRAVPRRALLALQPPGIAGAAAAWMQAPSAGYVAPRRWGSAPNPAPPADASRNRPARGRVAALPGLPLAYQRGSLPGRQCLLSFHGKSEQASHTPRCFHPCSLRSPVLIAIPYRHPLEETISPSDTHRLNTCRASRGACHCPLRLTSVVQLVGRFRSRLSLLPERPACDGR